VPQLVFTLLLARGQRWRVLLLTGAVTLHEIGARRRLRKILKDLYGRARLVDLIKIVNFGLTLADALARLHSVVSPGGVLF